MIQDLKYSFQVLSIQMEQKEHTKSKLCAAASHMLLSGFQMQLCKHDRRAWEAFHRTLSMAKHLLDGIQSTSCFRKSLQNSVDSLVKVQEVTPYPQ